MNNTQQPQENKHKNIMEMIQNNELVVKPKIYFRIRFVALIIVLIAIIIVSLFLSSFILFTINAAGYAALPGFGLNGWQVFMMLFPWKLAVVEIILIILLEYLLRSFRFGYKVPVLPLLVGVSVLLFAIGFIVNQSPLHPRLLQEADRQHLPRPFQNLYENTRRPPPRDSGIFRGTIEEIGEGVLKVNLDNPRGIGTTTPVDVNIPRLENITGLKVGDKILILGQMDNGNIRAREIKINNNRLPPPGR